MKARTKNFIYGLIIAVLFILLLQPTTVVAQETTAKSRITVVVKDNSTTVWVTNFPKNSSVVVFDEQDNLLTITNTNEFGAAYIKIEGTSSKAISAKTLNGEVNITKHLFISDKQDEKLAIREQQNFSNKA